MAALIVGGIALATMVATAQAQHEAGEHSHADAAALKNPVKTSAASVAAGKILYDAQCATCHGATGKGDGKMAANIPDPKPYDLTDAAWKHGKSDGEIFTIIKDGAKGTAMRGFGARFTSDDICKVVIYLRTLCPKPAR